MKSPSYSTSVIKAGKDFVPITRLSSGTKATSTFQVVRFMFSKLLKKKWAFVTDYIRLKIIYENGGIYLDTDVELLKPLDDLFVYNAYFGFEDKKHINTGLGFGAAKGIELLFELMEDYNESLFVYPNNDINYETCPIKHTNLFKTWS